jgi:hypothetical protein
LCDSSVPVPVSLPVELPVPDIESDPVKLEPLDEPMPL